MLAHDFAVPGAPRNPVIRQKKRTVPKLRTGRSSTKNAVTVAEPVSQEMLRELGVSDGQNLHIRCKNMFLNLVIPDEDDDPKGPSPLDQPVETLSIVEELFEQRQPQLQPEDVGHPINEGLDGVKPLQDLQFPEVSALQLYSK